MEFDFEDLIFWSEGVVFLRPKEPEEL